MLMLMSVYADNNVTKCPSGHCMYASQCYSCGAVAPTKLGYLVCCGHRNWVQCPNDGCQRNCASSC